MKIAKKTGLMTAWILGTAGLTPGAFAADAQIPRHDGKPPDMSKPVQVYILMGQSNMSGMGEKESLEKAVKAKNKYPYLVDPDGKWTVRSDVQFVRVSPDPKKALVNNEWLGETIAPTATGVPKTIGVE
jgi:hypothetical protein